MKQAMLVAACQRAFGVRGVEIAIGLMRVPWVKIIDAIITSSCLVGVVLITQSLAAFFMLIVFGLWNYWRGLEYQAKHAEKPPEPRRDSAVISRALIEHVKNMPPGGALHCTSARDQVDFVVMESSDFEHIVDQAGMAIRKEKRDG